MASDFGSTMEGASARAGCCIASARKEGVEGEGEAGFTLSFHRAITALLVWLGEAQITPV
jgi:hypothetical protein